MNIQIRVQVPEDKSKSYSQDTDVQLITDPTTVRAVLTTIIACEAAIAGERKVERHEIGKPDVTVVNVTNHTDPQD